MFSQLFLTSPLRKIENLPKEYVVKKFFELGFYPQYNPSNDNYSCSCPICLEGDTGVGNIKRCYYLPDKDIIYCHRCGWSSRPAKWIKEVSGISDAEICREIEENDYDYIDLDKTGFDFSYIELAVDLLPKNPIDLFDKQQLIYFKDNINVNRVIHYLKSRRLYRAVNKPKSFFTSIDDPIHRGRLILPYYNEKQEVTFYQSRDVSGESMIRYLSKQKGQKSVFNLGNLDYSKENYYVFEGPIDSCFVKNGVAIGGINPGKSKFSGIQEEQLDKLIMMNRIWVLDSQYLDEAAREKSEILLNDGESVFIWPKKEGTLYKDFNEMCIDRELNEVPEQFILDNTFTGLPGLLKLKMN